jgi:hypothetical protein
MSAQPAYHCPVDHSPRLFAHGLPLNGVMTADDLSALPEDSYWKGDREFRYQGDHLG